MKPTHQPAKPKVAVTDGATITQPMTLTGMIRTSKGVAVAVATIDTSGTVESIHVGNSQVWVLGWPFVAKEHKGKMDLATKKLFYGK